MRRAKFYFVLCAAAFVKSFALGPLAAKAEPSGEVSTTDVLQNYVSTAVARQYNLPLLPSRSTREVPGPSERESKFAANMSAFYRSGGFMKTPFAESVDPLHPRPEHPKPQLYREGRWESLNGPWQVDVGRGLEAKFGVDLRQDIVVPFPIEAPLSGLALRGEQYDTVLYRRKFTPSLAQPGERLLLHVERADWHAKVFVNGQFAGEHKGGFGSFTYDITDLAHNTTGSEANELFIQVVDPTENSMQPLGKQRASGSGSILYTSASGIWGDVWVEYVPQAYITDISFLPDATSGTVQCLTKGNERAEGLDYLVAIFVNESLVITETGSIGTPLSINIQNPAFWSPDSPVLYTATAYLATKVASNGSVEAYPEFEMARDSPYTPEVQLDLVKTYFGIRKISLRNDSSGRPRIMLNDEFSFQVGFLDQGYIPDGIYTYATESALLHDLMFMKSLGATLIRKHIKVESDRWYYHAARLGFMISQDMPSGCGADNSKGSPVSDDTRCWTSSRPIDENMRAQWRSELDEIVQQHLYCPSLVQYNVFNEGWGQSGTVAAMQHAMEDLDPGKTDGHGKKQFHYLWNDASGWVDYEVGHVLDLHRYTRDEAEFKAPMRNDSNTPTGSKADRATVLGEYGGIKVLVAGHTWQDADKAAVNAKDFLEDPSAFQEKIVQQLKWLGDMMLDPSTALNAGIFTQPFDVEYEINGLQTYDRMVTKIDVAGYKAAVDALLQQSQKISF